MTILCLCRQQHHWKLIPGYADAFRRRGIEFFGVDDSIPFDAPLEDVLRTCPIPPSAIFISNRRTRSFQSGSNALKFRPYVFNPIHTPLPNVASPGRPYSITQAVFHPGYEERFKRAGSGISRDNAGGGPLIAFLAQVIAIPVS